MGVRRFDRKFGVDLLRELPEAPAVYLFKDERGEVLYAGKAVNIRRRLRSYRNATRRKAHRKMRTLVREASEIEIRPQASELDALLVENELIQTLRPRYNVDGAYSFLYPAIGTGADGGRALFCFTTRPEAWRGLDLRWHGTYRSRLRAKDAFDALVYLLALVGHMEPRSRLPASQRIRGSRLVALRRIPPNLLGGIDELLAGESSEALGMLSETLVEKPQARFEAETVEERLRALDAFLRSDVVPLRDALRRAGRGGYFIPRDERDALFLATRDR